MLGVVRLAVQYSASAAALARRGELEADLFKCPPWAGLVAQARAVLPAFVHFDLQAGRGAPTGEELSEIERWRGETDTPWVNTHLAPPAEEGVDPERLFRRVLSDVVVLVERFGASAVIVENVPWERRPDFPIHRLGASAEWMSRLVEELGCGLLLDLAHARLAAEELGTSARSMIEALPLERLRELHVTGLGFDGSGRRRDSMPMEEADLALLDWALGKIASGSWARPWAVALEYGGVGPHFEWRSDEAVLTRDLAATARLLERHGLRPRLPAAEVPS